MLNWGRRGSEEARRKESVCQFQVALSPPSLPLSS